MKLNGNQRRMALLAVIYLSFISLGLPDGILGMAWPFMRMDFGMPLESMGVLTAFLLILSALSSFFSGKLIKKLGTGGVTFLSCLITGLALLGFAASGSFVWLLLFTIPMGFGQGAVDSGLNHYVAQHYSARHMNWLHCFWGMGASLGPLVMTWALSHGSWRTGYGTVAGMQIVLAALLFISLIAGFWRVEKHGGTETGEQEEKPVEGRLFRMPDQLTAVLLCFLYSGVEFSVGSWLNSVLVESRHTGVAAAGIVVAAYYAAVMAGRFFSGFLVGRLGNLWMIRGGLALAVLGGLCAWLLREPALTAGGIVLIGLGLAPVYPCLMHETPRRFTEKAVGSLIGYQVGAACLGGSGISALTGVLLSRVSMEVLFPIIIFFILLAFLGNEVLACRSGRRKSSVI